MEKSIASSKSFNINSKLEFRIEENFVTMLYWD